ncbi:fatty-acid amide hydrolase 2-B-like [Parasteatoda tepidariorum]|uniref:fatty-acid amide hydrolase 2-B-like n=2 Tax=Parasteatoda tepidariorum TaxID=114398 RepID=UPI001C72859F|nr:fatty-acid amide hydrolase 2-B-like [Parasteatoda tepidariorum]
MVTTSNKTQSKLHGFTDNARRISRCIFYRILIMGFRFGTFLLHIGCSLFYCGRGKVVPPIENPLLLKSATVLAADIREGKVKSETIVQAYIDRIQEVEPYINATTYQRFSEAIQEARLADELVASGKMSRSQLLLEKPLLGIPISIKQLIQIEGLPFHGASLDSKDVKSTEDADVIKYVKKAGAIILVTTNTPEKGLNLETFNKLNGWTNNPYDTTRSPSGSSGGEAALIGAGASVIGIGNDSAGSLRMPGLFCGIYSHKPTVGLVSPHGQFACIENVTTIGPMCRYAEDLMLLLQVLSMDKNKAIKDCAVKFSKLKIYYTLSMCSKASPSLDGELKDAFLKVLSHFDRTYGIKSKEVSMPLLKKSEEIYKHNLIHASGNTEEILKLMRCPPTLNPTKELIKYLCGVSKYTIVVPFMLKLSKLPLWYRESDVSYYKDLLQELQKEFDELLDDNSVFLCPTLPVTALHHVETQCLSFSLSYVGLWNLLGLPATHCPLGLNENGLPLGLQVVSSKNNDGLNFLIAEELERVFGGWVSPGEILQ